MRRKKKGSSQPLLAIIKTAWACIGVEGSITVLMTWDELNSLYFHARLWDREIDCSQSRCISGEKKNVQPTRSVVLLAALLWCTSILWVGLVLLDTAAALHQHSLYAKALEYSVGFAAGTWAVASLVNHQRLVDWYNNHSALWISSGSN